MNLVKWKNIYLEKLGTTDLRIFLVLRKEHWSTIRKNIHNLPFECQFIDPATYQGKEFTRTMIELNEKAYGVGMAAPAWTFANFGTIGAGITGGFLIDGQPVSKFSVVGDVSNPDISHEWTLLSDPSYQGKGLGTLTLALAFQTCRHKKYHTFIMQTDNTSCLLYLKNAFPLEILSYGFIHTRKNSFLIKTQMPSQPFATFLNPKKTPDFTNIPEAIYQIPAKGPFKIAANNHQLFLSLNDQIIKGKKYQVFGWLKNGDEKTYVAIKPLKEN